MTGRDTAMAIAALRSAAQLVDDLPANAFTNSDLNGAAERLMCVMESRLATIAVPDLDLFEP